MQKEAVVVSREQLMTCFRELDVASQKNQKVAQLEE